MRYIVQIIAMASDLIIIAVSGSLIYFFPKNLFAWILVGYTFKVWHDQGGFMAWSPSNIKIFFHETKKIGL